MSIFLSHPADRPLSILDKGVPPLAEEVPMDAVAEQGWNVLREDLPLPVAIIKESGVRHNSEWMKSFLSRGGAYLAPHGKTTMSPALFDLQLSDGAWALTVSTPHQIQVARTFGYKRIFLANQLVGARAIDYVVSELAAYPDFEFFLLVDSIDNAQAIAHAARRKGLTRPVEVFVEIGYSGGRTGCRSVDEAVELARAIRRTDGALALRGIEGFEGLLKGSDARETLALVHSLMDRMIELAQRCDEERLFDLDTVYLSAGGSAFYDVVVEKLGAAELSKPTQVVLRSGCYITHDSVMYTKAANELQKRNPELAAFQGGLMPSLEVWAYVQSRPEPEKLIAAFGKRDISYDDQPVPLVWFRPGSEMQIPEALPQGHVVTRLNDQHCHLTIPADTPLKVGDMVGFGISHPCLTFDKWRVMHIVDDQYQVRSSIRTYF
ncbi:amino acid deaminase [Agrobacterium larrymoorei]|uniref:Amino acid deaminase n=1 Tax=Agrobacterium larrymoorei TaxID=160699 RepID=A0AAF0HD71_9HYPH|nr:amino acid deaminase [Agrobacterium larrymoorei]WHA43898.1 amino acid deaminase [Agrobacterium larrymoorei]